MSYVWASAAGRTRRRDRDPDFTPMTAHDHFTGNGTAFVATLRCSRVLADADFARAVRLLDPTESAADAALALVGAGVLTPFQAQRLLARRREADLKIFAAQLGFEQPEIRRHIIHDQDMGCHGAVTAMTLRHVNRGGYDTAMVTWCSVGPAACPRHLAGRPG